MNGREKQLLKFCKKKWVFPKNEGQVNTFVEIFFAHWVRLEEANFMR